MGAGGAVIPPKTYFEKIQAVLAKYDVLMVADEVITGFFRTGNRFACETFGIRPDILVIAKQLSSAYLPISAVILNEKVYGPIRGALRQERHPRHRLHLFGPSGARRGRPGDDEDLRRDGHRRPRAQGLEACAGTACRARRSPARRRRVRGGSHRLRRARQGQGDEGELRPVVRRMGNRRLHPARGCSCAPAPGAGSASRSARRSSSRSTRSTCSSIAGSWRSTTCSSTFAAKAGCSGRSSLDPHRARRLIGVCASTHIPAARIGQGDAVGALLRRRIATGFPAPRALPPIIRSGVKSKCRLAT